MLAICNKISEPSDLAVQLVAYCQKAFGPESLSSIEPFANLVEELRSEALLSNTTVEAQRNGLKRYLGALEVLEAKFPIGQPLSVATKVPFPPTWFTWSDSFRPRNKVKGNSVRFERACVLFNFAANQSLLARDTDRSSSEGQKTALNLYQQAAGVFNLLKDQLLPACVSAGDVMGVDLSESALSMCAALMLAQAQALFYEKAVRDKSSRGLLAKLANQASSFYATAAYTATALRSHLDPSWEHHCRFQEQLFLAAAHLQQTLADKPNVTAKLSGFGVLVARLRFARDLANSLDQIPNVSPAVSSSVEPLKEVIRTELTALEYDNTNVYIEVVPSKESLAPIGLVPAVKPTAVSLAELIDMSYVEAHVGGLEKLAPIGVKRKAELLDAETAKMVHKLNGVFSTFFKIKKPFPFPLDGSSPPSHETESINDDTWSRIARIQVLGGPIALDGQLATLHGLTGECEGALAYITRALEEEEKDDKSCRERFGTKFNRQQSADLTSQFKNQLANYRQKCLLAVETNRKVRDRIASQDKNLVGLLGNKTRLELDQVWNDRRAISDASSNYSVNSPETQQLKEACRAKLAVAEAVIAECRQKIDHFTAAFGPHSGRIADIIQSGDSDKFVHSLVSSAENACTAIQEEMKKKFIIATAELDQAFTALLKQITSDDSPRRGNWLQALDTCSTIVLQGFSDVAEGVSFFNKLSEYLRKLKAQVDDFCFARNEEKTGLLQNIQRGLASASANFDSPQINFVEEKSSILTDSRPQSARSARISERPGSSSSQMSLKKPEGGHSSLPTVKLDPEYLVLPSGRSQVRPSSIGEVSVSSARSESSNLSRKLKSSPYAIPLSSRNMEPKMPLSARMSAGYISARRPLSSSSSIKSDPLESSRVAGQASPQESVVDELQPLAFGGDIDVPHAEVVPECEPIVEQPEDAEEEEKDDLLVKIESEEENVCLIFQEDEIVKDDVADELDAALEQAFMGDLSDDSMGVDMVEQVSPAEIEIERENVSPEDVMDEPKDDMSENSNPVNDKEGCLKTEVFSPEETELIESSVSLQDDQNSDTGGVFPEDCGLNGCVSLQDEPTLQTEEVIPEEVKSSRSVSHHDEDNYQAVELIPEEPDLNGSILLHGDEKENKEDHHESNGYEMKEIKEEVRPMTPPMSPKSSIYCAHSTIIASIPEETIFGEVNHAAQEIIERVDAPSPLEPAATPVENDPNTTGHHQAVPDLGESLNRALHAIETPSEEAEMIFCDFEARKPRKPSLWRRLFCFAC